MSALSVPLPQEIPATCLNRIRGALAKYKEHDLTDEVIHDIAVRSVDVEQKGSVLAYCHFNLPHKTLHFSTTLRVRTNSDSPGTPHPSPSDD